MTYISAQQAAHHWGISKRRVQILCSSQRIPDAVRIGNMWVVPENAQKPVDARKKVVATTTKIYSNPIRTARKSLRSISTLAFQMAQKEMHRAPDAKKVVIALFARELLNHVIATTSENIGVENDMIASKINNMFNVRVQLSLAVSLRIREQFKGFLSTHPFCIDDALSWAYQYVNKLSQDTGLEPTQFFTEKYMIATLVDQCEIKKSTGKILDPACGGANFLLYALDYLCDNVRLSKTIALPDYVHMQLNRLYGYELDSDLAIIASVNIRIKAISILKGYGYNITFEDFFSYVPNVYHSAESNMEGVLDPNASKHRVIKAGTDQLETLASVLGEPEFIFTNPPFKTVKGMAVNQKSFLKDNYPNAKCDMCSAFIIFALSLLSENGVCGLVTQNSWMYLDSFEQLRLSILQKYSIKSIMELGSNAFYDISGEKANVVLLLAQKTYPNAKSSVATYCLKHLNQADIEQLLSSMKAIDHYMVPVNQFEMAQSPSARFSISSTNRMQLLQSNCPSYGEYAAPMQGTSTGNAEMLVSYFWEHIKDPDWLPVSKGGGYSRWLGLNSYSVKWGQDGKYIKETPGSAIRNAKYFGETQMVFSDTGTAGLNVRLLRDGQIFIASGPGIRIIHGETLAHIAFLNSRFSSYFIRLLSPKLTIAAGYIAQIPVLEKLLLSKELQQSARICIEGKRNRLIKRPIYLEYEPLTNVGYPTTLDEQAQHWFLCDMEDEWLQLCAEKEIDELILNAFDLSDTDCANIDTLVGRHALDIISTNSLPIIQLDQSINELLSVNCTLKRTRPIKGQLGCDGILEYLAHKNRISPNQIHSVVSQNTSSFQQTLGKYRDAYIHSLVLSALGYSAHSLPNDLPQKVNKLVNNIGVCYPSLISQLHVIEKWIKTRLTSFHRSSFLDTPIIQYSVEHDTVESTRRMT